VRGVSQCLQELGEMVDESQDGGEETNPMVDENPDGRWWQEETLIRGARAIIHHPSSIIAALGPHPTLCKSHQEVGHKKNLTSLDSNI